jgi:hypothetical protein
MSQLALMTLEPKKLSLLLAGNGCVGLVGSVKRLVGAVNPEWSSQQEDLF